MRDELRSGRRRFLGAGAAALGAAALGQAACAAFRLPDEGPLPSLAGATGWLNGGPPAAQELRGRVVLVDFGTYTCINWLRTLPHIRAWDARYRDHGLVVVGVHTPEFGFERDADNVRRALEARRLRWPMALDANQAVWNAFDNHYWPAVYVADGRGRIRYHRFGEGEYEWMESVVRRLLAEAGVADPGGEAVPEEGAGIEAEADWGSLLSPENYVGYARTANFASSEGGPLPDTPAVYEVPPRLALGQWALSGSWTVGREAAVANAAGGRIACRFHARDLHLVMHPPARGGAARFRIRLDGRPPDGAHGLDADASGEGRVSEPRLYQLVRQPKPVAERTFEIEFLEPGVEVYAFTFG